MASSSDVEVPAMRHGSYVEQGGYLLKKSTFHKKRRYIRLHGSMFQIWKSEEDWIHRIPVNNDTVPLMPIFEIGLQNCSVQGNGKSFEIEIKAPHRSDTFVAKDLAEYSLWYPVLREASNKTIKDFYSFVKVLGQGAFGKVLLARDHNTSDGFAVKMIKKDKMQIHNAKYVQREMDILRLVNHPNLVRLYDLFDTDTKYYFVMEYMSGGILYDVLSGDSIDFSEERVRQIMKDLLNGLEHLHSKNVVHRDVKPDNILTTSKEWPFTSKLADFGMSNFIQEETRGLNSQVGTPYFCAREILMNEPYGPKADLWSLGVLVYEMLSGFKPFEGETVQDVYDEIEKGVIHFNHDNWARISEEAKDFVKKLICVDVEKRMSTAEALQHPWVLNESKNEPFPSNVLERLGSKRDRWIIQDDVNDDRLDTE